MSLTLMFDVYSAKGEFIKTIFSFREIKELADSIPDKLFNDGDKPAWVESGMFKFRFKQDVLPQDLRDRWYSYNNYPVRRLP